MRLLSRLLLVVLGLALTAELTDRCRPIQAGEPAPADVARLIQQLGNTAYQEREAATKALEALGEPALQALYDAAARHDDAEVRRRAADLVELILTQSARKRFLRRVDGPKIEGATVSLLNVSPDGRRALSSCERDDGELLLLVWDLANGKEVVRLSGLTDPCRGASFSRDGRYVVAGGYGRLDSGVQVWDLRTGKAVRRFEGHTRYVYSAFFSPDNSQVLSCGSDSTVRLWDAITGEQLHMLEGHRGIVYEVAFSPDGRYALSGGSDCTLRLWDLEAGTSRMLWQPSGRVNCVAFSPDGMQVLGGGGGRRGRFGGVTVPQDCAVRLWSVKDNKELRAFLGHSDYITDVAFSPDGRRCLSGSRDQSVRLWDLATGRQRLRLPVDGVVNLVAFSPDGHEAFAGIASNSVQVWSVPK